MSMNDIVCSTSMRPVFVGEPAEVRRRLKAPYPENWFKVLVGETQQLVTISEYLYEDKYSDVVEILQDLVKKKDLAMYKRQPEKLQIHIERTATRLIRRILEK